MTRKPKEIVRRAPTLNSWTFSLWSDSRKFISAITRLMSVEREPEATGVWGLRPLRCGGRVHHHASLKIEPGICRSTCFRSHHGQRIFYEQSPTQPEV